MGLHGALAAARAGGHCPARGGKTGLAHFVKPANAGSSVGISKARDMAELEAAVDLALQHDSRVVFERFVQGQEVECAVRGNDEVSGTHPGEILASAEFYTYDDKYISGTSRVAIPAQLAPEKLDEVRDLAVRAYRALCCKGLARVDFLWSTAHSACCSTRSTPCRALPASACIPS